MRNAPARSLTEPAAQSRRERHRRRLYRTAALSAAGAALVLSVVCSGFSPLRAASAAGEESREDIRSESWIRDGDSAAAVPSILQLPGVADAPSRPGREALIAGFPMDKLMLACAPGVHPDTMEHLVRRASGAEPWSVGHPGETFYSAASPQTAAGIVSRLEDRGVNCTVGLLQIPASVLREEGVEPREALDPCVNLRLGARLLLREWNRAREDGPDAPGAALAMALLAFEERTRSRSFVGIAHPGNAGDIAPADPQEAGERSPGEDEFPDDSGRNPPVPDRKGHHVVLQSSDSSLPSSSRDALIRIPGAGDGGEPRPETGVSPPAPVHVFADAPRASDAPDGSGDSRLIF